MKQFIASVTMLLMATALFAQLKPTDQGSSIKFKVKNFGINSEGSFSGLDGKITFDPAAPENGSFNVSIDAASVNTDNSMRDGHLKKESYFDVEKYPRISFVSTSVSGKDKSGHYKLTGKLTIKDVTKEVSFPFIATAMGNDYIFSGEFTINRQDYHIGGSSTIANSVTISLTVLAKKE